LVLVLIFGVKLVHQHILNVDGLARTCWANKEGWDFIQDAELLNVAVTHSVNSGDNDVLHGCFFAKVVDLVLVD